MSLWQSGAMTAQERKVLAASTLGTVFEWYDFMLFGSLAPVLASQFFSKAGPTAGLIFALLAFSAGFIVRPFGALVFGRLGDLIGRKYTFLATIVIMGTATFLVGLLPTYDAIGIVAPIALVCLRLLQGLAVGGEYGGAAVYVAENAPHNRRGEFTSWIQMTGTLGLLMSLLVVLACRTAMGEAEFTRWGWRLPFLLSIILLAISVWIRLSMQESPAFAKMKAAGKTSTAPLAESFARWGNVKLVLIALFGLIAGFTVLWYTAQFYVLLFLTQVLKVDAKTTNVLVAIALVLGTPFYVVFGALSDRIGRKKIMFAGLLLAAALFFPIFKALMHYANPALEQALRSAPVVVSADPAQCHIQFNLTGTKKFTSSCDIAKAKLVAAGVNYANEPAPSGSIATIKIGATVVSAYDGVGLTTEAADAKSKEFAAELSAALAVAGYPTKADPAQVNKPMIVLLIFSMVILSTMTYGPSAATLVEMFPTKIRYSSLSLPYHIGTGWLGGTMPVAAFALVAWRGDIYFGLWYTVTIILVTFVIGLLLLPETKDIDIHN
jgi:MFS family permease